jgi:L-ribulose-5-phosphate 4-epimerase
MTQAPPLTVKTVHPHRDKNVRLRLSLVQGPTYRFRMFEELKQQCYEANVALPKRGLINLTFGNASVIDRTKGVFAIKPSGVDYNALRPEDIVIVDLEGRKVEGMLNASSDTPTHRRLFLAFTEVGGIVHTHSVFATAFAQAGRSIPCLGTTQADYFIGEVPVTRKLRVKEIGGAYEWETGNVIVEHFERSGIHVLDCPGVLVNRHGPFTWGKTVADAVDTAVALEFCANLSALSMQLKPQLKSIEAALLNKHFRRKHGSDAYYGQTEPERCSRAF